MRFSLRREVPLGLAVYALYLLVARLVLAGDGARASAGATPSGSSRSRSDSGSTSSRPSSARCCAIRVSFTGSTSATGSSTSRSRSAGSSLLYRRRDGGYHRFRRACLLAHVGAQPVFLLLPTAPPRVLDGFVDTLSEVSGLDLEHPLLVRLYNPVAAMPSLHVAFAVVTGAEIAERVGVACS